MQDFFFFKPQRPFLPRFGLLNDCPGSQGMSPKSSLIQLLLLPFILRIRPHPSGGAFTVQGSPALALPPPGYSRPCPQGLASHNQSPSETPNAAHHLRVTHTPQSGFQSPPCSDTQPSLQIFFFCNSFPEVLVT